MDFSVKFDVAVIGGGIAGAAAALQAARLGKKTVLIEKTILLGGLATSGLVYIYLPLCDGNGHQVSFGITEELLRRSYQYGPGEIPANWQHEKKGSSRTRFVARFSPAAFMLSLEEMLLENGVDLWLDTLVCDTKCRNGRMTAVIVENESGRGRISAQCFIDASGSCITARRAGVKCLDEDNYLTMWSLGHQTGAKGDFGSDVNMFFSTAVNLDEPHNLWLSEELQKQLYSGLNADEIKREVTYRGLSGRTVTRFVTESHRVLREHYKSEQEKGLSRQECYPLKLPLMPQFRKTYCIPGEYVLKAGENNRHFDDSIGLLGDWRKAGPVWEVPFRTLYTNQLGGLLAAGRCTAASGDAWEITRVIPSAGLTGQVAGLAAAMSIDQKKEVWDLDIGELQDKLRKLEFRIHLDEAGLPV